MTKRVPNGSTVRINCPEARGVHGKVALISGYSPEGGGTYKVTVPELQYRPSFLLREEFQVLSESQARASTERITIQDVVTEYGEEDAARFAFELLVLLGHELDHRDGEIAIYGVGGE